MAERRATAALVAVMVTTAVFKEAISDLRGMTIDESGLEYDRPQGSATLSAWFGQLAADRANADTMLIPATVQDVRSHVREAIDLEPRGQPGSSLPPDVQAAAAWVARNRGNVPEMREQRCAQLEAIEASLAPWSAQLWRSAAPHVRKMLAYAPKLAFIHALVVALKWPHNELVLDMAMGAQPLGRVPDTGVWRHAPPAVPCDSFEQLMQEDPDWNTRLYNSIKAEGTKPENSDTALAAWARTMEEVDAGWATPVAGERYYSSMDDTSASLTPDALALVQRGEIWSASSTGICGSGYIRSIRRTAEIAAVIAFSSSSETTSASMAASLTVDAGSFGGGVADADYSSNSNSSDTSTKIKIRGFGLGLNDEGADSLVGTNIDDYHTRRSSSPSNRCRATRWA